MAESIDALPTVRRQRRRRAEPPARAAPKLAVPAALDCPRWLLDALARRGLEPRADRPVHRLLRECDLPEDVEEHEKVPVGTEHDALQEELAYVIRSRYRNRPDVLVAGDLFVYFDGPGTSLAIADRLAPDLMVAFGVPDRRRSNYVVWREGKAPDFVLEIFSPSTRTKDIAEKPALYRRMGVREYFQFDPDRRTEPRLAGWRFGPGETRALPLVPVAGGMRGIHSEALDLHLCHIHPWPLAHPGHETGRLRWHDPATGAFLETLAEVEKRRTEQARRADAAERERDAAERERDEAERERDAAERRAEEEAAARRVLEKRVAALGARLRRQPGG